MQGVHKYLLGMVAYTKEIIVAKKPHIHEVATPLIIKQAQARGALVSVASQQSNRYTPLILLSSLGLESTRHFEALLWAPFHALF